ncbi:sporulation integral membrane protein YlbJ [Thermobacillus sp. ZCTH02-B1]|uniref:sporulation integral membrane protein YlbJ n=1 Tax=Thermobacillus sp. ZCTH02-B1 TaxID=1858795 RepID=UPI0025FC4D04|nr:sporulation integral membrane protein YlbJ [Thermobacillus sp. ZCTH02-B1]
MARLVRSLARPAPLAAACGIVLAALMAAHPAASLEASLRGVAVWWDVLFPALFPFFVMAELMLGFGVVHFFGTLLDPLMRPLFRLPGIAGFVVTMGLISGYPVGARLASRLREQGQISRTEGERLVAFVTTSDPIFLIGAVSVGFFHDPALAPVLAAAHYGGALVIGLAFRRYRRQDPLTPAESPRNARLVPAAFAAMHRARTADGRTPGRLLADAVGSALRLNTVVGGLVVFFSVVMELLARARVLDLFVAMLQALLQGAGLPAQTASAFASGLFEVTLGAKAAGEADAALAHRAAAAAWVLSWAGLSVHAQIASIIGTTDIRYAPFLAARAAHGVIGAALVYLLWGLLGP